MIDINNLTQSDVGRWIIFTYTHGETQRGKLKSWNHKFIFGVFHCGDDWDNFQNYTGESCQPDDVHFEDEEPAQEFFNNDIDSVRAREFGILHE